MHSALATLPQSTPAMTSSFFLLGKGVEAESLSTDKFNVTEQMELLVAVGGKIMACGTCLKLRKSEGSEICPISSMKDLHQMVVDCDKVLTF